MNTNLSTAPTALQQQPKKYHFNLQDSSYYISLNITKKKPKHLSDSNLLKNSGDINNKVNFLGHNNTDYNRPGKFRLDKMFDFNETNMHHRKYQFINPMREFFNTNAGSIQNKLNLLNLNDMSNKYQLGVSKQTHKSNLNVSMEGNKKQNQMYRIEIGPSSHRDCAAKPMETFHSKYLEKLQKYRNKYCHGDEGPGTTKIEIGTSDDLKLNKFNAVPLSSRSNYARDYIDEFPLKSSGKSGKLNILSVYVTEGFKIIQMF